MEEVQRLYEGFVKDIARRGTESMKALKRVYEPLRKINMQGLIGRRSMDRLQVLLEKLLLPVRERMVRVNIDMAKCLRSLNGVLAAFLCEGCNPNATVIAQDSTPTVSIHDKTRAALELACSDYTLALKPLADEYRRVKVFISDYISAEVGVDTDDCSCGGQVPDKRQLLNSTWGEVRRRLLEESASRYRLSAGTVSELEALRQPFLSPIKYDLRVVGSDKELNSEAEEILKKDFPQRIDTKRYMVSVLTDYKKFLLAMYTIVDSAVVRHIYSYALRGLMELVHIDEFTLEERIDLILKFATSFLERQAPLEGLLQELVKAIAVDFLLNVPVTAFMNLTSGRSPREVSMKPYAQSYGAKLKAMLELVVDGRSQGQGFLPYLLEGELKFVEVGAASTIYAIAATEVSLLTTHREKILLLPVFWILNELTTAFSAVKRAVGVLLSEYLTKLNRHPDSLAYLLNKYFPEKYYRDHPEERVLNTTNITFAEGLVAIFKDGIVAPLQRAFNNCLNVLRLSKMNRRFAAAVVYPRRGLRFSRNLESARRRLNETEFELLLESEYKRQNISERGRCLNETECRLTILLPNGSLSELKLPVNQPINVNWIIDERRWEKGKFAVADIASWFPYDDEMGLDVSKCPRALSPRTGLCVPLGIDRALHLPTFNDPTPVNPNNLGPTLLRLLFNRNLFWEFSEPFVLSKTTSRMLTSTQRASVVFSHDGMQLSNAIAVTGLRPDVTIDGINENSQVAVDPMLVPSSSPNAFRVALSTALFLCALLLFL